VVEQGRLQAVDTAEGPIACGQAVIAAGAWSEQVLAGVGARVPTPPVKGQIVLLDAGDRAPRRIIEHGARYLVPRDEGRVLVGSTEEHVGFDTRPTSRAVHDLIEEAVRLCPGLADVAFESAWAGLRPGSIDSRPTLGPIDSVGGLYVATGHKRAGLQLSTGTAVVLGDLLLGRTPRIPLDAFRIDRPASAQAPLFRS
jgi:glycine oxidase